MGNIKGIRVELTTRAESWAASGDKLFLGLYGTDGGREFHLNGDIPLNKTDYDFSLVLGDPCCKKASDQQVQYSIGLGDNDPLFDPIDLQSLQYAYVRKETANSTSVNDDVLALSRASVLVCDSSGSLRQFRTTGKINFSDETGLTHWLGEIAPPTCQVVVTLRKIRHRRGAQFAAGKSWYLIFGADKSGEPKNFLNWLATTQSTHDWSFPLDISRTMSFVGCCGEPRSIVVRGEAIEIDLFRDDTATTIEEVIVPCSTDSVTHSGELELTAVGAKNHVSIITFEYDVVSICLN